MTVLVFRDAAILTMRRAPSATAGAGIWEGISGRVRAGEDPPAAAVREVLEESGLTVHMTTRPVDSYASRRGDEPMTVIVFRADYVAGEVTLSDEHDDFRWTPIDQLSTLGVPPRLVAAAEIASAVE